MPDIIPTVFARNYHQTQPTFMSIGIGSAFIEVSTAIFFLVIWDEEDNISIGSNITCAIYTDIPMTRLAKKKDVGYKYEVAPEPAS